MNESNPLKERSEPEERLDPKIESEIDWLLKEFQDPTPESLAAAHITLHKTTDASKKAARSDALDKPEQHPTLSVYMDRFVDFVFDSKEWQIDIFGKILSREQIEKEVEIDTQIIFKVLQSEKLTTEDAKKFIGPKTQWNPSVGRWEFSWDTGKRKTK